MSVDIKIKGLDEALAQMENLNPKIEKELTFTLNDEGVEWRDDVRANTPVDSGELRRSMTFEDVKKTGSGFEMSLSNNTEYAGHVEFGHRTRGGKGVVKGVYMMKKGTTRLEQRLPSKLEQAMERALGD
ncbi:HK97 gp10 family phage protein [Anaerococcus sp. Marseille-Q5996]|uniref:HK97 gp10 family phage protein n=1 Tax=Anaerococcus sp. Marseille-Q5996 TaxID=2972769 RepID=UPI0021C9B9C2|nr:HK97 gp10 family phage protein [Anaerococcus sp. Marseille-Q5996]